MITFKRLLSALFFVFILTPSVISAQNVAPVLSATGNQQYCPGTPMKIVTDFNIVDPDDTATNAIYIQISSGYVNGQDILTLSGNPQYTTTWDPIAAKLTIKGINGQQVSYADLITAVENVVYTNTASNPAAGVRTFSITMGQANYLPSTGHYYQFVSSIGISWTAARTAAANSTYYGLQGYLATLLSADEAQLCGEQATGTGWIGGTDMQQEGVWRWVTGPPAEVGTVFWNGGANGSSPNFEFWNNGEPNNAGDEDYAHITAPGVGIPGSWNDLKVNGDTGVYQPKGYIVEYGGMQGDPVLNLSASASISVPSVVSTTPGFNCGPGSVLLQASVSGGIAYWYATPNGGSALATGSSFTTPQLATTTTYYVSAYPQNCTGTRIAVTATIRDIPTVTFTNTTLSTCGAGTVTLEATATTGATINWYDAPNAGNLIGTGQSVISPIVTADTTFYAEATGSNNCISSRIPVQVTLGAKPTIVINSTTIQTCGSNVPSLTATASAGTIGWYTSATGGTPIATGNTFTPPAITADVTYYAEADDNGCLSASRAAVNIIYGAIPTVTHTPHIAICIGHPATIQATASAGTINWYTQLTGGIAVGTGATYTTAPILANTTYYAEADDNGCVSVRTPVDVVPLPLPTLTVTPTVHLCGPGTATLQATSFHVVNWYTTPAGGTSFATGLSVQSPPISAPVTVFYAEAQNIACTSPTREAVTVYLEALPTVTTTPTGRCGEGTVTLQGVPSAGTIKWYNDATGGVLIGTGNSIISPNLTATTTFYAEAETVNGCTSAMREPLTVNINNGPAITIVAQPTLCGQGSTTLEVTTSAGVLTWYDAVTGGTALATGTSFTTPNITTTTTYYIEADDNGCIPATRFPVIAMVIPLPTLVTPPTATACEGSSTQLTATPSAGIINWYTDAVGGTPLATGNTFTTPAITADTIFYAEADDNGCLSSMRQAVAVTLVALPAVTDETLYFCEDATLTLDAGVTGVTYVWQSETGAISAQTQTIEILSEGTYTVVVTNPAGCSATKTFTVYQYDKPVIDEIRVSSGRVTVLLENDNPENYVFSVNGADFQTSDTFYSMSPGVKTIYVKEIHGCGLVFEHFVIDLIPRFITPNNDNYNDVLSIRAIMDYPNATMSVFDRYGKLIVFLNRHNNRWDGSYNNSLLPATDYWYVLKLDENTPEIKGHFALMR